MIEEAYSRYCAVQKMLENDGEYLALEEKRRQQSQRFLELLDSLPDQQQEIVVEYMGICAEQNNRITEIACFIP